MKRFLFEMVLILAISLFLSLLHNAVSPSGLRILPKREVGGQVTHESVSPGDDAKTGGAGEAPEGSR